MSYTEKTRVKAQLLRGVSVLHSRFTVGLKWTVAKSQMAGKNVCLVSKLVIVLQ